MEKITLEELMKEKIYIINGRNVICTTRDECDYEGNFERCFLHTCCLCPHYVTPTVESGNFYRNVKK